MTKKEWFLEWQRDRYEYYKLIYAEWIQHYPFTTDNLDGEIWLPIPNYEELYHGSNFGRVKSFHNGKVTIRKPSLNAQGYLYFSLWKNNKEKKFYAHVLVANLFIPNPDNLPEVDHRYGIKFDCSVWNLHWVTEAENVRRAVATGLQKSGEDCSYAKLTSEQVLYIRENPDGLNQYQLAEKFGVKQTAISAIQRGKSYKNAGGKIRTERPKIKPHYKIPVEIREKVRAHYRPGVRGHGAQATAKIFGISKRSVFLIVNEQSAE